MKLFVLCVFGAVLVHNSAAQDPDDEVPDIDQYTYSDGFDQGFTEAPTHKQHASRDLVMDMLLAKDAKDGERRSRAVGPPGALDPLKKPTISRDPINPDAGYHCGNLEDGTLFNAYLKVLNESAYVLKNVWINPQLRYDQLKVIFKGPKIVVPLNFILKHSDKFSGYMNFVIDTKQALANLDEVTVEDNLKQFSASLNITGCRRIPQPSPKFRDSKYGVSSGDILRSFRHDDLVVIQHFTYPGNCPAAYFWVGTGGDPVGFKVPTLDLSPRPLYNSEPLRAVTGEDALLKLPDSITYDDLDYIGVFCPSNSLMLAKYVFKPSI